VWNPRSAEDSDIVTAFHTGQLSRHENGIQKAQLSQRDRATRFVSWNPVSYGTLQLYETSLRWRWRTCATRCLTPTMWYTCGRSVW